MHTYASAHMQTLPGGDKKSGDNTGAASGGGLISAEDRAVGAVQLSVYKKYFSRYAIVYIYMYMLRSILTYACLFDQQVNTHALVMSSKSCL